MASICKIELNNGDAQPQPLAIIKLFQEVITSGELITIVNLWEYFQWAPVISLK